MLKTVLFLLLLIINTVWAMPVNHLNTGNVEVKSRSPNDLKPALINAYQQVLVKMSGNPTIMSVPKIQNSVTHINHFLVSYGYQQHAHIESDQPTLFLRAVFDRKALRNLLEEAGQTLWGENRPLTLVIVAARSGISWQLISEDQQKIQSSVTRFASDYGLKVIFPTFDLEDQQTLSDIGGLGLTTQQLQSLAKRYHVSAILYAAMDQADTETVIDWRLWLSGQTYQWPSRADKQSQAIKLGMSHLLGMYANQYATLSSQRLRSNILLKIVGVDTLQDYTNLLATLRHLSVVKAITIKDMSNNAVVAQVGVVGGKEALLTATHGTKLAPDYSYNNDEALATTAYFHWKHS